VSLQFTAELQEAQHKPALDFDGFTSRATVGWLGGNVFYFHRGLKKCRSLGAVQLPPSHTGEVQAAHVTLLLNQVGLQPADIFVAITDNASVVDVACTHLGIPRLPCMAHTLNLVLKDVFANEKETTYDRILSKAKAIVTLTHKSVLVTAAVKEAQQSLDMVWHLLSVLCNGTHTLHFVAWNLAQSWCGDTVLFNLYHDQVRGRQPTCNWASCHWKCWPSSNNVE